MSREACRSATTHSTAPVIPVPPKPARLQDLPLSPCIGNGGGGSRKHCFSHPTPPRETPARSHGEGEPPRARWGRVVRAGPGLERAISRGGNWVRFKITRSVLLGCAPPGVPSSFCFRSDSAPPGGRGPGSGEAPQGTRPVPLQGTHPASLGWTGPRLGFLLFLGRRKAFAARAKHIQRLARTRSSPGGDPGGSGCVGLPPGCCQGTCSGRCPRRSPSGSRDGVGWWEATGRGRSGNKPQGEKAEGK